LLNGEKAGDTRSSFSVLIQKRKKRKKRKKEKKKKEKSLATALFD